MSLDNTVSKVVAEHLGAGDPKQPHVDIKVQAKVTENTTIANLVKAVKY